ncbi:hypothetical protein ACRALDRAFT_2103078 [Sodiomyces alcalophilus JCM 7366]|uniref:uncharacterized protein n=1 Tax=Sodiomyces alcalophilus JCM 7366 TaxID=591952 RepID=UPI0039B57E0F
MSSISRAFTNRRVKQSVDIATSKKDDAASQRNKSMRTHISSPLELIHTTNMLSYNAPDIARSNSISTTDGPESPATINSTPPTSPDIDTKEESRSPAPNHLSCYFMPPQEAAGGPTTPEPTRAPAIPMRSPSHTKKSSLNAVAKQRSVSTMSKESDRTVSTKASATFSRTSSTSTAPSTMSRNSLAPPPKPPVPSVPSMPPPVTYHQQRPAIHAAEPPHPFGRELEKVSEIAEEFGIKRSVLDEEEREMRRKGLRRISPDEYLNEVEALFATFYGTPGPISRTGYPPPIHQQPPAAMWI